MAGVSIKFSPTTITPGSTVTLTASPETVNPDITRRIYRWSVDTGIVEPVMSEVAGESIDARATWTIPRDTSPGDHTVKVTLEEFGAEAASPVFTWSNVQSLPVLASGGDTDVRRVVRDTLHELNASLKVGGSDMDVRQVVRNTIDELNSVGTAGRMPVLPVALQRTRHPLTTDIILWMVIRKTTQWLSFNEYCQFVDSHLCPIEHRTSMVTGLPGGPSDKSLPHRRASKLRLPFPGVDAYRKLKALTEVFLMERAGVLVDFAALLGSLRPGEEGARIDHPLPGGLTFEEAWKLYLEDVNGSADVALPYLAIIRNKLPDVPVIVARDVPEEELTTCYGILQQKLGYPIFLELIWNYWIEESMLVQAMNYLSRRFQNVRGPAERDPLANLEIDPLRPLNNLLWGYIQDEQHRLSVIRRAHEYVHEYGFTLYGKAVAGLRPVDRRSKFLESFHNLLHQCVQFFRQDDDTTVVSDGFPVLNALKETHYLLAMGAHSQFGDLPATARQEMLVQQWLLSRPEMREFLGGRVMVPYPEPWMDRVDAMKSLMGWTDVSVVHFHDLAVFGEQVLLSVRYGAWSVTNDPNQAVNWARYWRAEIQGYIHAYRAVTGVDLTTDITDPQSLTERYVAPSVHLRNRLAQQRRR